MTIKPFSVHVADAVLADLNQRIRSTRWPHPSPAAPWQQGTDLDWLQGLLRSWADGFDWRAQERNLNQFSHFHFETDDTQIHFVHAKARHGRGIPLILSHGWPSAFLEYLPLVPLLTDPASHGIDGPAFDLVIPSLPGYGFSGRPHRTGINYRYTAALWHQLMAALGYTRYGAGGGDFGAGVTTWMALDHPQPLLGIHLTNLELSPYTGPGSTHLTTEEQSYHSTAEQWWQVEGGYKAIQSSKPQTLAYALNDSPAGLAAWICEKWRSWSDCQGDLDARFSRDFLLTLLTLYWVTGTISTSMRDYFDNRWQECPIGPNHFVQVPTAIANFTHQHVFEGDPPRHWAQRLYNVQQWNPMPRGGHFAPMEEPLSLARDIAAFFKNR